MTIDVSDIIERRGLSPFLIKLAAISWVITFFDGFDLNVISYAAPYIASGYHLDKAQLANVFSAGTFGAMVGGFLFGYLGDRIGRRPAILIATISFGILTLGFALVSGYDELVALRFIDGVPIGGMLPLAWALNIEYAPRRFRSTIVTLVMIGYSLGSGFGGVVAYWIMPLYGWQVAFLLGGGLSLLTAIPLLLPVPERVPQHRPAHRADGAGAIAA
jgi:AAHS family 4-hydroxybenzoate transporter-like MFS transporter